MREQYTESIEETMTKAFSRLVAIDSRRWIQFLLDILPRLDDVDFTKLTHMEQQMLNMLQTSMKLLSKRFTMKCVNQHLQEQVIIHMLKQHKFMVNQ